MENPVLNTNKEVKKVTIVGFICNALLAIGKLLAGYLGKSVAMVADGVNSLSDFLTDIIILVGLKFTNKPEDECHNYGHEKYETLTTAIVSIFIAIVGFEILKSGITSIIAIIKGDIPEPPKLIALIAAGVTILIKECLYRYFSRAAKKLGSSVILAKAWDHRSDVLTSTGALIGIGGAIFLGPKWVILDPIAALIVGVFIFRVAYRILKPAVDELMERALSAEALEKIGELIKEEKDIIGYHHLRTRNLGKKSIVDVHIFMDGALNIKQGHDIANRLEHRIKDAFGNLMVITIHVEPYDEERAKRKKSDRKF